MGGSDSIYTYTLSGISKFGPSIQIKCKRIKLGIDIYIFNNVFYKFIVLIK